MAAAGVGVRVENFGATTFQSSMELVKLMTFAARVADQRLPHVVGFYDGYNEANHGYYFGAGHMQNDLSAKLAALVEHKSGSLLLYGASLGLATGSAFWKIHVHRRLERALFHDPDPQPDEANLRRAVDIYLRNTRIAQGDLRRDWRPLLFRAAAADCDQDAARAPRDAVDRRDEAVADRVCSALL